MKHPVPRCALVMIAALTGCISVPLPSQGPELERISPPRAGDDAAALRRTFGDPQRLDTSGFWLYEWSTERRFVIVPVFPSGVPAGAPVSGNRYRMLVRVDPDGTVGSVSCTARELPEAGAAPLECEPPLESFRGRARQLFAYRLDFKPGFEKTNFHQSEGTGATTAMELSSDGRLLAATDSKNRLWVLDTESGAVRFRHDGERIRFFDPSPAGPVVAAFSPDGGRLVVVQHRVGSMILDRRADGTFTTAIDLEEDDLRQVAVGLEGEMTVGHGELGVVALKPDGHRSEAVKPEPRLDFDVRGPHPVDPAGPPSDLVAVRFGRSILNGGRCAVFSADGRGVGILDLRNDFARDGTQGFRFSPDGRRLARNTCRHLEMWPSAELLGLVENWGGGDGVAPVWVALMPFANRRDEDPTCHAPVAFRSDGGMVAAASPVAIHVWRTGDGEQVATIGALKRSFISAGEESVGQAAAADFAPLRVLALALAPDNRLTAVLANSSHDIYVGAWQIED